ncbi:balbiani ring protein 3-like [Teleopsis dalmanni]|uniref:balbiani ring protein 3-like n=1 Tax=Teleopsis dalmanni TaxID=139649 RepID=UPI0018CF05F0|nr:balbiani ring protein 3-like [Teleopsis dalmanni]
MPQKKKCVNATCQYMKKFERGDSIQLGGKKSNTMQSNHDMLLEQNTESFSPHKCCASTPCKQEQPQPKRKFNCKKICVSKDPNMVAELCPDTKFKSESTDNFHDCASDMDCDNTKDMIKEGLNKLANICSPEITCNELRSKLDNFAQMLNTLEDPTDFYEGLLKLTKLTEELFKAFDISYQTTSKVESCPKKQKECKHKRTKLPPNDKMCGTCSQKRAMAKPVMQCCERHKGNKSCKTEKKPPKCKPKNICPSCGQDTAYVKPGDHGCETKKPENSCESKKEKEKPKRSCGQKETKKCGHPEKAESEAKQCCPRPKPHNTCTARKDQEKSKNCCQLKKAASQSNCEQTKPKKCGQPEKAESEPKQCCQRPKPQKTCKAQKDQDKSGNCSQLKKAASQSSCEQTKPKKCGQPEEAEPKPKNCCQRNKPQTTCASKKPKSSCEDASIKNSPCSATKSQQACSSPQDQDAFEYPQTLTKCKPFCKNKCSRQPKCAGKQIGKLNKQKENNRTGGQCCQSRTEHTQQAEGKCQKANQSVQSCESQKSKKSCGAERQPICLKKQKMQNVVQNGKAYLIDPISVLVPIRIKRKVAKKPTCEKNDCDSVQSEPKSECETDTEPEPEPPCMPEPVIEVEDECEPGPVRCPGGDTVMKHKLRKLKRRRSPNEPEMDTVHLASETTIFSFEESRSSFSTQNDDTEYLIKEIYYDDNESFTKYIS